MNRKIWLAITVLVLIWGSVAFAGPPPSLNITDAELEALWGADITAREFLERYGPEMLEWMRRRNPDFYALLDDTPVGWGVEETVSRWEGPGEPPPADGSGEPAPAVVIVIAHTVRISERHGVVDFGASSTVIVPPPPFGKMSYMHVWASLREGGWPIASTWDDGHNVLASDCERQRKRSGRSFLSGQRGSLGKFPPWLHASDVVRCEVVTGDLGALTGSICPC